MDGWQPTVKGSDGTVYATDASGKPTGAVVIQTVAGENVSVVQDSGGQICVADRNGQPTETIMAITSGSGFVPVYNGTPVFQNTGSAAPSDVKVVTLQDGSSAVAVPSSKGWSLANADGSPSFTVVTEQSDGTWSMGSGRGSGGGQGAQTVNVEVDVSDIVPNGTGAQGFDLSKAFQPIGFKFGQQPSFQMPGPFQQSGYPGGMPVDPNYLSFMQQFGTPVTDAGSGGTPGASGAQPSDPGSIVPDGSASAEDPGWGDSGTYLGTDNR